MGISLQGAGALAGSAVEGFQSQRADNREQADENRTARDDAYNQTFNAIQAERSKLDDVGGGAGPTQTQAIPGGTPQGGALPAGGGPAAPAGAAQQSQFGSRREAYKDWHKRSGAAAAMAGGLEGLKAFQDHESALSRKQMMGYGMSGVQAMAAGSAGEAVKQLNTMLEVSPEDTGMKFEAFDGKVHLVGADGKRSQPYNQEQVMAVIESKLKTPENYLAFQSEARQQGVADETARSNLEKEKTGRRTAATAERAVGVGEREVALDEKYRGRETSADEAKALAALIAAKAARERAAAALSAKSGWTASQQLQIYKDADNWAMEDQELLPGVNEAFRDDPEQWAMHKSDVMNQMTRNAYDRGPTREEASVVSQFLRQPGGVDLNQYMQDGQFKGLQVGQDDKGVVHVNYNGKTWQLPYSLGVIAIDKIPEAVAPPADASAETDGALPAGGGGKEPTAQRNPTNTSGIPVVQQRDRSAGIPERYGGRG
jgi:hypothetical protein